MTTLILDYNGRRVFPLGERELTRRGPATNLWDWTEGPRRESKSSVGGSSAKESAVPLATMLKAQ